uniref:Uncharacterized protein n=1 Tax=viral metagenome TaxID=1070528 RepID=A0A6M3KLW7_9ZZZZ
MRILTDEEIVKLLDISVEYDYIDYTNCETVSTVDIRPALKAQHKQDIKDFIELLEAYRFYDDFGGDSAKGFRDRLVETLQKLLEE